MLFCCKFIFKSSLPAKPFALCATDTIVFLVFSGFSLRILPSFCCDELQESLERAFSFYFFICALKSMVKHLTFCSRFAVVTAFTFLAVFYLLALQRFSSSSLFMNSFIQRLVFRVVLNSADLLGIWLSLRVSMRREFFCDSRSSSFFSLSREISF